MNYIHQLKRERDDLARELAALKAGINDLRAHLRSSKFHCDDRLDGYINTGDVLWWLRNAEDAGTIARETVQPVNADCQ